MNFLKSLKMKVRRKSIKKPVIVKKIEDSISKSTGNEIHREMTVDREKNIYQEKIVNSNTGEIIHDVNEPLDRHTGHGDAKNN